MKRARKCCGSGADDEAAARYQRGLAIAREQGARSVELRAATSPALVYEWFTEGFDTRRHVTSRIRRVRPERRDHLDPAASRLARSAGTLADESSSGPTY